MKEQRRSILRKEGASRGYREIVLGMSKIEEEIYKKFSDIVCRECQLSEENFVSTQQYIMAAPQYQQAFYQKVQPEVRKPAQVTKTKQEMIEAFKWAEKLKLESMEELKVVLGRQRQDLYQEEMVF
mmetsp:Transcript_46864/g.34297  ORF Transcript_46864/g.34297 Transcript_46864/m.34297 type:complete len:126 (+) Transcript_46864:266-643(+)|eukprot:CAMPEP_0202979940 /NCGR_PEP_ID=MMETSP1396-20130829/85955_1 /ASSEMBLY_ACC=CAM_ASM_000872 /TAXON_ID= /ORGANISM="Pseudokeronopsis sp., Strain Brazil" /LENGTH=125 /DNA_ID=CAMNT_0049719597 /DNA_START=245 /DNA_END=622 /DNA_ORIENTATION=+